ncbi:MAG: GTPase Era [Clostridiales bacterium]|nr:GTPase Era [Clostridiales bacterium]
MEGYKSGFAAVIGRSNVGKSTIMNTLIGEKVAIVSDKPQTTRNRIHCVLTRKNYQIIFIDTPGIHRPKTRLGDYMVKTASSVFEEVDVIIFVVDVADGIGSGDRRIAQTLKNIKTPIILALNKVDIADEASVEKAKDEFANMKIAKTILPISALKGDNLSKLESVLVDYMPDGPQYYPTDMLTDQPERFVISELIREKTLTHLYEEIPHGIGVEIVSMIEREDRPLMDIRATIYCEKKSHKGIIIGRQGKMLQKIGKEARADIERLLGIQVYLELWVKVKEDWRDSQNMLRELGYN